MSAEEKVIVFDTTLRDGEQAAGTRLGVREKLELAVQLARLGVDVINGRGDVKFIHSALGAL